MCNEKNHSICYTITTCEECTFKNENKIVGSKYCDLQCYIHVIDWILNL